jgi:hypothetical protein
MPEIQIPTLTSVAVFYWMKGYQKEPQDILFSDTIPSVLHK